jgi:hypothetical protein
VRTGELAVLKNLSTVVTATRPRNAFILDSQNSGDEEEASSPTIGGMPYSRELAEAVEDLETILAEQTGWQNLKCSDQAIQAWRRKVAGGLYIIKARTRMRCDVRALCLYLRDVTVKA